MNTRRHSWFIAFLVVLGLVSARFAHAQGYGYGLIGGPGTVNGGSQPVNIQGNRTDGSDKVQNACINGVCPVTAFGALASATDNSAAFQAAINAAYQTGTGSGTKGKVTIGPDATGGTTYKFTSGIDFKEVPVECGGPTVAISAGLFNITLDFTGMPTGTAAKNAGWARGCRIVGPFTAGSGKTATISSIVDGSNNTATVTLSGAITDCVTRMPIIISGTTNYNGIFEVASCTDTTHFTFQYGRGGIATENAGTIHYSPTVGIDAHGGTTSLSCCSMNWDGLYVGGFGNDYNASSMQNLVTGSVDNGRITNSTADTTIVGIQALGSGTPITLANGTNVGASVFAHNKCTHFEICLNGGQNVNGSGYNDAEEVGFGDNDIGPGFDMEAASGLSADSPYVAGIIANSYGNHIHDNYMVINAGAGQTSLGDVDTQNDSGANFVWRNRLGGTVGWVKSATDEGRENNQLGLGQGQFAGIKYQSGIAIAGHGTTSDLYSARVVGATGGTPHCYGIVGHDKAGGTALASTHFMCPGDSSATRTPGSCGCTAGTGPSAYGSGDSVQVCYIPDENYSGYDILIDDTSHVLSAFQNSTAGSNGNHCFSDVVGSGVAYTPPVADTTGGINLSNANAIITVGSTKLVPGRPVLMLGGGSTNLSTANAGVTYLGPNGASATEGPVLFPMPTAGTMQLMTCSVNTAPGASNSYQFQFRHAFAANLNQTCTISGTNGGCSDAVNTDAISAMATTGAPTYDVIVTTTVGGSTPTATGARCELIETGF